MGEALLYLLMNVEYNKLRSLLHLYTIYTAKKTSKNYEKASVKVYADDIAKYRSSNYATKALRKSELA